MSSAGCVQWGSTQSEEIPSPSRTNSCGSYMRPTGSSHQAIMCPVIRRACQWFEWVRCLGSQHGHVRAPPLLYCALAVNVLLEDWVVLDYWHRRSSYRAACCSVLRCMYTTRPVHLLNRGMVGVSHILPHSRLCSHHPRAGAVAHIARGAGVAAGGVASNCGPGCQHLPCRGAGTGLAWCLSSLPDARRRK